MAAKESLNQGITVGQVPYIFCIINNIPGNSLD